MRGKRLLVASMGVATATLTGGCWNCGNILPPPDYSDDAGPDAGRDGGPDGGRDGGSDGGRDAGLVDAGTLAEDAPSDAGAPDTGIDGGP